MPKWGYCDFCGRLRPLLYEHQGFEVVRGQGPAAWLDDGLEYDGFFCPGHLDPDGDLDELDPACYVSCWDRFLASKEAEIDAWVKG